MSEVSIRWREVCREVTLFGSDMLGKLWHHRRKQWWMDVKEEGPEYYLTRLREETDELEVALYQWALDTGTPQNVIDECADVANFAMMIASKMKALDTTRKE
jgi:hypothetical protein